MALSEEQLEQFRKMLIDLQSEIEKVQDEEQGAVVELDQNKVGRLSRMDALQSQQMALETQRRNEKKLLAIAGALRRIEAGDFGYCYVCDDDIALARLEFDPTITRCRDCAE